MIYIIGFAIIIVIAFIFSALKSGEKIKPPVLTELRVMLETFVSFYCKLSDVQKKTFENKVTEFLSYVHIEGIGTEVDDIDRVLVASSAVIPIFGFPDWKYHNLTNVILYPDTFNKEFQFDGSNARNTLGMVGDGYMNGQMILSKNSLKSGFVNASDKHNTGIHEFVHLLDMSDGAVDGVPEILLNHAYSIPWLKMVHQEISKIQKGKSDIDVYAATNEAEFLAVISEYFFERPDLLESKHPELYKMLQVMFSPAVA